MGKEFGGDWIHVNVYGWVPLLSTQNYYNIVNHYTPIQNKKLKKKKDDKIEFQRGQEICPRSHS